MLTIIIGIVLAVCIFFVFVKFYEYEPESEVYCDYDELENELSLLYECAMFFVPILLIVIFICLGLFFPLQGYTESIVKEVELVSFSNDAEVYLLDCGDEYSYKYVSIEDEEKGSIYETKTIDKSYVKKEEFENCETPLLVIYEKKPRRGLWTFAFLDSEKEYKFEVPKNTIKYIKVEENDEYVSGDVPFVMP